MAVAKHIAPADCADPLERRRRIEAEPLPANVWQLLEDAAREVPEQLLWDFFQGESRATYSEVRDTATALARGLSRQGVRRGTVVAIMLPNVPEYPLSWLAAARLGAVVVPLNPQYTVHEVRYVLEDAEATFAIVHHTCAAVLESALDPHGQLDPENVVVVGAASGGRTPFSALVERGRDDLPKDVGPGLDDLLNIQYTSGTTGLPKGCLLTHRHWLTCGKVNARRDGRVYRRILASTPFFYMDPHWLLLMTLFQRATLFVAERQSASHFMEWVRQHRIEFCLFPELVLKQPPSAEDGNNALIRMNIYGVKPDRHAEIEQRFNVIAREAYGMTEMGSVMFMPMEAIELVGSGSCGIPSPFRECRIVDSHGTVLDTGEVGELQVRGHGRMLGYHRKPEANTAAFDGEWFRTGDLFRQDERGYYYLVGRLKDMIRRSGENVSAQEVERVLRGLPEVLEAAVIGVPDETRGEELLAIVVPAEGTAVEPDHLFSYCAQSLARFKIPRFLRVETMLPKTPSGKIAKGQLRDRWRGSLVGCYDRATRTWL
jgi:long-chain acyl-CoA synthetase